MITLSSLLFLADENIHPEFIAWLNKQGIITTSIGVLELNGNSDEAILKYAEEKNMVIITHDSDFGRIVFTNQLLKTGIIYLRPGHISFNYHFETFVTLQNSNLDFTFPFMIVAEKHPDRIKIRLRRF